jgi:hypothetical protein
MLLSGVEFRKRAFSNYLGNDRRSTASKAQTALLNAAYTIYAAEVGKLGDKQGLQSDNIADLRVEVEKKNVVIAEERTRFVLAALINKENLRQFGLFWVRPYSAWGKDFSALSQTPDLRAIPERLSDEKPEDAQAKAAAVDNQAGEKPPAKAAVKAAAAKATRKNELDDSTIASMPWYYRYFAIMASKIFGEMTPLATAILFLAVSVGAILYGEWSKSTLRKNLADEQAAVVALNKTNGEKDAEIKSLRGLEQDLNTRNIALRKVEGERDGAFTQVAAAKTALNDTKAKHLEELRSKEESFREQLKVFNSDAIAGYRDREQGFLTQIKSLQDDKALLDTTLTEVRAKAEADAQSYQSQTATEQQARADAAEAERKRGLALNDLQSANTEKNDFRQALDRTKLALAAVELYFWDSDGSLEIRRACYRRYYRTLMAPTKNLLERLQVPTDIRVDSYDIDEDPSRRLSNCDRYFG